MITKKQIKNWMQSHLDEHTKNGEVNMTTLAESCIQHFGLSTTKGESEEEEYIFEIATEYFSG